MLLRNVQLTVVFPYVYDDSKVLDILTEVKDIPMVKRCLAEGRTLTSYGVSKRDENETEVVLNFE